MVVTQADRQATTSAFLEYLHGPQRPVMDALKAKLVAITEGRDPAYEHWVTRISIA
jgi:hypothetical protein